MRYIIIERRTDNEYLVYDVVDKEEKVIKQEELDRDIEPFEWSELAKLKGDSDDC